MNLCSYNLREYILYGYKLFSEEWNTQPNFHTNFNLKKNKTKYGE